MFLPPAVLPAGAYNLAFKTLMALCGIAALFAVVLTLVTLGASRRRLYAAAGAVRALTDRRRPDLAQHVRPLAGGAHGRSARRAPAPARAARLRPARARCDGEALSRWSSSRSRRSTSGRSQVAAARCARSACSRPSPCSSSCRSPSSRPAGSGTASTRSPRAGCRSRASARASCSPAHQLGLYAATVVHGATGAATRDLAGSLPDALATITTLLQAAAVAAVWWLYARGSRGPERLVLASAAAVTGVPRLQPLRLAAVRRLADPARAAPTGRDRGRRGRCSSPRRSSSRRSGSSTTATCSSSRGSRGSSWRATRCCSRSTCCSSFA